MCSKCVVVTVKLVDFFNFYFNLFKYWFHISDQLNCTLTSSPLGKMWGEILMQKKTHIDISIISLKDKGREREAMVVRKQRKRKQLFSASHQQEIFHVSQGAPQYA